MYYILGPGWFGGVTYFHTSFSPISSPFGAHFLTRETIIYPYLTYPNLSKDTVRI